MTEMKLEAVHIECMIKLVEEGPLHRGEVADRATRDDLIRAGFLSKIVFGGEDGFVAATYLGQQLYCKKIVGIDILREAVKERRKRGAINKCSR